MGLSGHEDIWRQIVDEVVNGKRLELTGALFTDDHQLHPETPGIGRGPDGMRSAFAGLHEEFPDIRAELEAIVAEGDMAAVRLTFRGTHAASGKAASWPEMVFTRFEDGKVAESWEVIDTGRGWESPPW